MGIRTAAYTGPGSVLGTKTELEPRDIGKSVLKSTALGGMVGGTFKLIDNVIPQESLFGQGIEGTIVRSGRRSFVKSLGKGAVYEVGGTVIGIVLRAASKVAQSLA